MLPPDAIRPSIEWLEGELRKSDADAGSIQFGVCRSALSGLQQTLAATCAS